MRFLFLVATLLLIQSSATAQSISVAVDASTRSNSSTQFTMMGNTVSISGVGDLNSVSSDLATKAIFSASDISIQDEDGRELLNLEKSLDNEDGSSRVYVLNDGSFIVREIVSNFEFYDSFGRLKFSVNNNTNSEGGESVSELSSDPMAQTIVLYNPKIIINGQTNSRASVLKSNGTRMEFFYSDESGIRTVEVSDDANYISVITESNKVFLYDRYGNSLNEIDFDQDVVGATFSDNGRYITIYSGGRAAVYSVISGERQGSTSFRGSPVVKATYFPQDNVILAVTGDRTGNSLSGIQFHAINIKARKIARENFGETVGMLDAISLSFNRTRANRYSLAGLSKKLNLTASF